MNIKYTRYAAGAVLFLVLSVSFTKEAVSTVMPSRMVAVSEVSGTLNGRTVYPQTSFASTVALRPTKIIIPSAKVNADIIDIGVTATNNLDVPPNYTQAGWYKYGPLPGSPGNAVIDGHVDNGGRIPGPFKNLRNAKIGDEITVQMSDGSSNVFVITNASVSSYLQFPKEFVFKGNGDSVLKIITCHGRFLPSADTYDQRLIVTAVKKPASVAVR